MGVNLKITQMKRQLEDLQVENRKHKAQVGDLDVRLQANAVRSARRKTPARG